VIYVECKPDYVLVRSITKLPKKEIIHAGNKSEVCKKLEKQTGCIGLVDEDPWSEPPPYMKKMKVENLSDHNLKRLCDNKNNFLFVFCPRLEEWVLQVAKRCDVEVERYGLPNDGAKLHEKINANLDRFEKLIESLRSCDRLRALGELLVG